MGGETRCKWCGAAIKPWTDRYVDMAGGELCQDGGQEQFARRHSPAERVIEVAPQGEIPDEEDISECTNCPTIMSLGENEPYRHPHTNAVLCNSCYIDHIESALTAAREERDRTQAAIYWADGQRGEFRERGPKEGAYWWRKELMERAGLQPVSDRQPEGETVVPREAQQLFEETEKIDQMRDDSDWHMAVCLFESAITKIFRLCSQEGETK